MKIQHGKGSSDYGPGVSITLSGDEVATAICAYLVAHGVHYQGSRTVTVNGGLCQHGEVYVGPEGFVVSGGVRFDGRGGVR